MLTRELKKQLDNYGKNLKSKKYSILCPSCRQIVLPKDYENHCLKNHDLNPKLCCVWCMGNERWPGKQKYRHTDHLRVCSHRFIEANIHDNISSTTDISTVTTATATTSTLPEEEEEEEEEEINISARLLNLQPLCEKRQFFDVEDIRDTLHPNAFSSQTLNVLRHDKRVDYFRDENLNSAASYVRLYVETTTDSSSTLLDWYHLMIKAVTFESFLNACLRDGGRLKTLPFSCWCDGGPYENARHRQHRHLIATYPKDDGEGRTWKNFWDGIGADDRPSGVGNFPSKRYEKIKSPMHLVNTLGYVCKRESRCRFTGSSNSGGGRRRVGGGALENKHFYIFETLPVDYLLPLCVQWDGGLDEMLYQEKFQSVSIPPLLSTITFTNGKWRQKIKNFYGFEKGFVLPLLKVFGPTIDGGRRTDRRRRCYCYLTKGRKLYLDRFPEYERLDDESWLRKQVEGGNCFYDNVGEETWAPRKRDQEKLTIAMPIKERNRELESEKLKTDEEMARLKSEYDGLKLEYDGLKSEYDGLKSEYDGLKSEYDAAMNGLNENREENEQLRTRLGKLRLEIATLKRNMTVISNNNIHTINMSK